MRLTESRIRHLVRGILSESESSAPITEPADRSIRRAAAAIDALIERAADKIINDHPEIVERVKSFRGLYGDEETSPQIDDVDVEIEDLLEDSSMMRGRVVSRLVNTALRPILSELGVDESLLPDEDNLDSTILSTNSSVVRRVHRKINPNEDPELLLSISATSTSSTAEDIIRGIFVGVIDKDGRWRRDPAWWLLAMDRIARATGVGGT